MKKKPQVLLDYYLKQLRLPTILREYRKVAEQCAREDVDCQRFLLRLVELEVVERERGCGADRPDVLANGGPQADALGGRRGDAVLSGRLVAFYRGGDRGLARRRGRYLRDVRIRFVRAHP